MSKGAVRGWRKQILVGTACLLEGKRVAAKSVRRANANVTSGGRCAKSGAVVQCWQKWRCFVWWSWLEVQVTHRLWQAYHKAHSTTHRRGPVEHSLGGEQRRRSSQERKATSMQQLFRFLTQAYWNNWVCWRNSFLWGIAKQAKSHGVASMRNWASIPMSILQQQPSDWFCLAIYLPSSVPTPYHCWQQLVVQHSHTSIHSLAFQRNHHHRH